MTTSTCPSVTETAIQMGGTALCLLILTLAFGHLMQGKPLDQLGQRPMGTGLWSFLHHQVHHGVGIWGYDTSLGAWSPLIRVSIHFSCIFGLWAMSLLVLPVGDSCVSPSTITMCGIMVTVAYLTIFYVFFHCMHNVSFPGGPRASKIQRQPRWNNETTVLLQHPNIANHWRCAVAEDSHQITSTVFEGTAGSLTGEPAGRQIWTTAPDSNASRKRVDENMVQEMASGGRPPQGFNPSVNPNRYVFVMFIIV